MVKPIKTVHVCVSDTTKREADALFSNEADAPFDF